MGFLQTRHRVRRVANPTARKPDNRSFIPADTKSRFWYLKYLGFGMLWISVLVLVVRML